MQLRKHVSLLALGLLLLPECHAVILTPIIICFIYGCNPGTSPTPSQSTPVPTLVPTAVPTLAPTPVPCNCFTGNEMDFEQLVSTAVDAMSPLSIVNCNANDIILNLENPINMDNRFLYIGPCRPENGSFDFNIESAPAFTSSEGTVHEVTMEGVKIRESQEAVINYGKLNLISTLFTMNTGQSGGALKNFGTTNIMGTSSFTFNMAGQFGGAIFNDGTLNIDGTGVTFSNNVATDFGGAIYYSNMATASILGTITLSLNRANVHGGAVYISDGSTLIINGTAEFNENTAVDNGGGIHNNLGTVVVNGANFLANEAATGGAVFNGPSGSQLSLSACTFTNNQGEIKNVDNASMGGLTCPIPSTFNDGNSSPSSIQTTTCV